jgi:hypothetical protein
VAVILAINFAPFPSLGLLLWQAGRVFHVDVMPQRIYWEDLQPGTCVSEDPNEMDYLVVDCNAEHEEEVMSRGTVAGGKEWPGCGLGRHGGREVQIRIRVLRWAAVGGMSPGLTSTS